METVRPSGGPPLRETITVVSCLCDSPRLAVVARAISLTLTSLMLVFVLAAQSPTVRNAAVLPFDCPYRQCELTYRTGAFGGRLQVGVDAPSEIGSGFTGGGIVRAMSGVPQAARIGRRAQVMQGTATMLRILAVVGTGVAWSESKRSLDPPLARFLAIIGGVLMVSSVPLIPQGIAHKQFGRATDVYNRELGR